MKYALWGAIVVIVAGIITWIVINLRSKRKEKELAKILPIGWHFYSNPTTLEPPGTVFRLSQDGSKYVVHRLNVPFQEGREVIGHLREKITTSVGILARFLGVIKLGADAGGKITDEIEYAIYDPVREQTTDVGIMDKLNAFQKEVTFEEDNRYFIIRECRRASGMKYILNEKQFNNIGGEASKEQILSAGGSVEVTKEKNYELKQPFPEPMRVMFLPEEIQRVTVGVAEAAPELRLVPVSEVLIWKEERD